MTEKQVDNLFFKQVLCGAGAGALYWGADRASSEEDAETEAKRKKIQYYRELSQELQRNAQKNYDI